MAFSAGTTGRVEFCADERLLLAVVLVVEVEVVVAAAVVGLAEVLVVVLEAAASLEEGALCRAAFDEENVFDVQTESFKDCLRL